MKRRSQRGFTLIEMMVVVAIIAILAGLVISMSGQPAGANPQVVSEQIVSTLNLARLRAGSTRRTQKVVVQNQKLEVFASTTTGLVPSTTWATNPSFTMTIPRSTLIWNAEAGANAAGGGPTPAQDTTLTYDIEIRPDGQAIASTIYLIDTQNLHPWRVVIYHATGGSYARQGW